VINQGDFLWEHAVTTGVIAKTIVSPLITFRVALIAAAATWVENQRTSDRSRNSRREAAVTFKSPSRDAQTP